MTTFLWKTSSKTYHVKPQVGFKRQELYSGSHSNGKLITNVHSLTHSLVYVLTLVRFLCLGTVQWWEVKMLVGDYCGKSEETSGVLLRGLTRD